MKGMVKMIGFMMTMVGKIRRNIRACQVFVNLSRYANFLLFFFGYRKQ